MQSELKPCAHETQCAKHTDTSRSDDLVKRLLDFDGNWHEATCKEAADEIERNRAEITRLTEALREARRIDRGRVVVPAEPTAAMKMAGAAAITEDHMAKMANYDAAIDCWAAMLNECMKDTNA